MGFEMLANKRNVSFVGKKNNKLCRILYVADLSSFVGHDSLGFSCPPLSLSNIVQACINLVFN